MGQKSCNSGKIRYCNKKACRECPNQCTKSKYKTVDFKEGRIVIKKRGSNKKDGKSSEKSIRAKVEHPFGTIKHRCDGSYLLLKG